MAYSLLSAKVSVLGDDPPVAKAGKPRPRLLIVFIGGMDSDPTPAQIQGTAEFAEGNSGLYRLARAMQRETILTEYFNWNGTRAGEIAAEKPPLAKAINACIRERVHANPQLQIAIVGNSWGGHTAWTVCQQLCKQPTPLAVELAVFLDPSSAGRGLKLQGKPESLPDNVAQATNYFTRNVFVWQRGLPDPRIEQIDLGDPDNGYMREGKPAYSAAFDFSAHVAAEWDLRIHADIERRLHALISAAD